MRSQEIEVRMVCKTHSRAIRARGVVPEFRCTQGIAIRQDRNAGLRCGHLTPLVARE